MAQMHAQMEWPRTAIAVGFVMILAGVAIGAITDGHPAAPYVALAGLLPIATGIIALLVQQVMRLWNSRRLPSEH
jgi:hypothetical protein